MITKLKHLIPVLLLALCILAAPAAAAGGAGTASNPYVIQTPAELQSIANDLSAYYVLGNDIDMSGYSFVPIGSLKAPFFGSLDGRGFTISGVTINAPSAPYQGIFSVITDGATIKNLNIENCEISGSGSVGVLYGLTVSTGTDTEILISGVSITHCTITSAGSNVGALCGAMSYDQKIQLLDNTIQHNTIINSGGYNTGGLSGQISSNGIIIRDCDISFNYIYSQRAYIGGLTGLSPCFSIIEDNYLSNNIIVGEPGYNVGGIIGGLNIASSSSSGLNNISNNIVDNCVIRTAAYAGGLVGLFSSSSEITPILLYNKVNNCTIWAGISYAGGIIGSIESGSCLIDECEIVDSTILSSSYAAGICPKIG